MPHQGISSLSQSNEPYCWISPLLWLQWMKRLFEMFEQPGPTSEISASKCFFQWFTFRRQGFVSSELCALAHQTRALSQVCKASTSFEHKTSFGCSVHACSTFRSRSWVVVSPRIPHLKNLVLKMFIWMKLGRTEISGMQSLRDADTCSHLCVS